VLGIGKPTNKPKVEIRDALTGGLVDDIGL
jgi:hypothetical protein